MNKNTFTKKWVVAALVRAGRTCAQTAIATIGTAVVIQEVNWIAVLSASALAGVVSLLMAIAGLPEVKEEALLEGKEETLLEEKEGE